MNWRHYNQRKLVEERESRDLTQEQVAKLLNKSRRTVLRAETGERASYDLLAEFADLYKIELHDLVHTKPLRSQKNFASDVTL